MDKPQGFGVPLQDGKTRINKKKRPELYKPDVDSAQSGGGYFGCDSGTPPPEANSVATETDSSSNVNSNSAAQSPIATDPTTGMLMIRQDELNRMVQTSAAQLIEPQMQTLREENRAIRDAADQRYTEARDENQRLQGEVRVAQAEATRLKNIFDATGNAIPSGGAQNAGGGRNGGYSFSVNTLILPGSTEPRGAAKDFVDMWGNSQYTPKMRVFDASDGQIVEQADTMQIDRALRDPEFRRHAVADFERLFKAHGLLRGDMGTDNSRPGLTSGGGGSIPDAFLPFVSSYMRTSDNPRYIWWQFNTEKLEVGRAPGVTILVPRFPWMDEPTDEDDFVLDTAERSESMSSESQAMIMLTTPVTLKGYGLGKGNKVSNRPVAIPEFITATSMVDLLQALDANLSQNYNAFEDMKIRRIFQQTLANPNNIYYNQSGSLTRNPLDVGTGDDGTVTEEVLNSLASEMTTRRIPTYRNGKRVGVLCAKGVASFKNSLGDKLSASTETEIQEITNILNAGNMGNGITKATGYLGTYCGFMLFESSTTGIGENVGDPGAEGIQATVFGAGSRLTRDNFFFGPGVVGHGISLPMEIRMDGAGTFGTKMRFVWRSMEGWGSIDCTSTNEGQQDRVLVLRGCDKPV
jgi:hypothetical protein